MSHLTPQISSEWPHKRKKRKIGLLNGFTLYILLFLPKVLIIVFETIKRFLQSKIKKGCHSVFTY